jgi:hypothetical protein
MRDEWEQLARSIIAQARLPGQGVAGYSSSVASVGSTGLPTPMYFVDDEGYPVRFFIPGRSPLYTEGTPERYILGDARTDA